MAGFENLGLAIARVAVMNEIRRNRPEAGARCPFYGFVWPEASSRLFQVAGNRCGLALDRVEPCAMEQAGHEVDMETCPRANALGHFIRSADPVMSFVIQDHPEGLSYAEWWRRTMLRSLNSS